MKVMCKTVKWTLSEHFIVLDQAFNDKEISDFIAQSKDPKQAVMFIMNNLSDWRNRELLKELKSNVIAVSKLFSPDQFSLIIDVLAQEEWRDEEIKLKESFLKDLVENKRIGFLRQQGVADEDIVLFIKTQLETQNPYALPQRRYIWNFINSITRINVVGMLRKRTDAQNRKSISKGLFMTETFEDSLNLFTSFFPSVGNFSQETISEAVVSILENMVETADNIIVRQAALRQLGKSKEPKAFDFLIGRLSKNNPPSENLLILEKLNNFQFARPVQCPPFLNFLKNLLDQPDYYRRQDVITNLMLHLSQEKHVRFLNKEDILLSKRVIELNTAGFPIVNILLDSPLTVSQLSQESRRVRGGGMDINNDLDVALNYSNFISDINASGSDRKTSFSDFMSMIKRIRRDNVLSFEIPPEDQVQIRGLVYESYQLWKQILAVQKHAEFLGRPVIVVENLSYGAVALAPITEQRNGSGKKYIIGTQIPVISTKIGSTGSHNNEFVLRQDLFTDEQIRNIRDQQPVVIVVDGTTSVSDPNRTSPHMPDAFKGYRNYFMAYNMAFTGNINPENFYEDEEFVRGLENNGDFKALVAKLKGFIPQSMDKLQPYQLKFWYPGRKDLYLRVNKQKDMVTPKMRSVREVAGPTVIFVQSGMEPESIPETIKNDFIKGGHEPAYFDDKEHYKSFYMDYKPGFGIVYSKKYTDFSREKFFDLLGLLKESIPKREEAPAVLISRDIDVVALDLDGTIAELNQKPSQKIIDQLIQIIKTDKKVVILTDDLEDSVDRRLEDLVKAIPGDFKSNLTVFSDSATKGYTFRGDGTKVYLTGYNQKSLLGEDTKNAVSNLVSDIFKEQLDLEKRSERLSTGRMDLRVRDGSDRTKVMVSLRQELTRKGIQVKVYKAGSKGIRIVRQHKEHALEWFLNSRDISSEKVLIMADAVKENQIDAELLSQFRQAVSINVGRDSRSLAKRNPSAVQLRPEHGGIKGAQNILQVLVRRGQIPETIAQMAVTTRQKEYAMMDRAMNTASEAKAMTRGGETGFKGDLTGEYLRIAERRLKERGVSYNNADKLRLATAMQEGLEKIPHAFSVSEPNFLAEAQKVLAPGNRSSVPFNSSAWARWLNQKIMERLSLLAPFEGLDLVPVRRVGQEKDMVGTVFRPFHKLVFHERMLRGDSARLQWVLVHEAMHFLFPGLRESYLNEAVTELMTEIVLGRDGSKGFIYANRLQVLKYVLSLDETGRVQKALLESYKTGDISLLRKENIVFFLLLTHLELFELEGRMVKGYGTGVMFKFLSEYHALIKKYNELSITGDPYAYVLSHAIGRFASEIMALNDHKSAFVFGTETVKNLPSLKSFGINPKILGLDDKAMAGERSVIGILENLRKSLSKSEGKEISVSAFAKRIGISYYYYSKFIDDEKAPGFSDIVEITKNLELTPKQKKELFLQWFKEHPGYAANELSKVLMVERLSLDLSREELAKKTGLTRVAIFNYETKGAIPSQEHCKKLAKALGLKNDELIRLGRDIIMQREIDKNDTSLAADIKKARISRGLKQREIAEKTGISKAYFGTIERGLAIPSIEITLKLAKQLGLNKEELSQKRNNEKAFRDRAMAVKTISSQDVKSVMRDHDVFVIHSIAPDSVPGENSLLTYNVSWEEKLQILLAFDPMVSASTIKEGDTVLNMWSPMGVVLKGGHILSANPIDGGTVAESIGARANARVYDKNISVSIGRAIRERKRDFYNELTVSSPEVAGIYVTHQRRVGPVSIKKTPPIDRDIRKVAEKFGITVFVLENGNLYRSHFDENRGLFVAEGEPLSKEQIIQQSFSMDSQKRQALKQDLVGHYPFRIQPKEFSFFQGWRLGREVYLLSSLRMAPDKVIKKAMSTGSNKDGEIILNDFFTGIDGKNGLSWRSQYYLKDGKVYRRKINRRGVIVASSPLDPYKNNVPEALFSNAIWHDNQGWSHQQRLDALEADIKIVIDRISKSKEQEGRERAVELQQDYLSRLVFFAYGYGEYADEIGDTTTSERAFAIARSVISEEKYRHFKQARVKEDNSFRYTVGDFKLLEDINPSSNPAMSVPEVKQKDLGGIDFNSNKIDLQVKNQGEGIQFKMDPAMLAQLQNASGFTPVIINIQPMNNLREFLGIDA